MTFSTRCESWLHCKRYTKTKWIAIHVNECQLRPSLTRAVRMALFQCVQLMLPWTIPKNGRVDFHKQWSGVIDQVMHHQTLFLLSSNPLFMLSTYWSYEDWRYSLLITCLRYRCLDDVIHEWMWVILKRKGWFPRLEHCVGFTLSLYFLFSLHHSFCHLLDSRFLEWRMQANEATEKGIQATSILLSQYSTTMVHQA